MKASLVVVAYNCWDEVDGCLRSLEESGDLAAIERVVVVDNASAAPAADALRARFPGVVWVRRARNDGFAAGANAGIRAAGGDAVLLLNPDARAVGAVVAPLVRLLEREPDVGIAAPRIEDPDGTLQYSCRRFPGHWTVAFNRYSLFTRLVPANRLSSHYLMFDFDHRSERDVDWVSGAAMLVRRGMLETIGLLDEGYFFSIEDVDLCRRAWSAGWRVRYAPQAVVRHRIGASSRSLPRRVIIARHRGMWRYYLRWQRGGRLLDVATAAGIAARCGWHLAAHEARRLVGRRAPGLARPVCRPGRRGRGRRAG